MVEGKPVSRHKPITETGETKSREKTRNTTKRWQMPAEEKRENVRKEKLMCCAELGSLH